MKISSKIVLRLRVLQCVMLLVTSLYISMQAGAQSGTELDLGGSAELPRLNTASSDERRAFEAELSNIQAMAFGFSAVCENGDLKLRSERSATFVISQSLLCELKAQSLQQEKRKQFTLCSNNPSYRERERREGRVTVSCSELHIDRLEI